MNVLSLFSGAGGMDLGLHNAGMTHVAMCEIDPTARAVLARHWPDVPIYDDVTTLDPSEHRGRIDLVAGGSPCQDLSVAGRRGGLDGARSGLFWHQCRIADTCASPWVLWENVAGAFSSNDGADFAAVLWGLTGTLPDVPDGGWRTAGVVVGPKRQAVWRLLDARWFGVAQRRRRVFVVAGPRGACGPEVLLEPEGVRGNPEPGGEAGQEVAAAADERTLGRDFVGTVTTNWAKGIGSQNVQEGFAIPTHTGTVTANWSKGPGNTQVDEGHVIAVSENQRGELRLTPYLRQLTAGGGKPGQGYGAVLAPAYPLAMRGRSDGVELELGEPDVYNALRAGDGGSSRYPKVLPPDLAVRRLTPRECERLMGWPDGWTCYRADGTEIADSHRYRMCGNGVVAPVAEWIGRRIMKEVSGG